MKRGNRRFTEAELATLKARVASATSAPAAGEPEQPKRQKFGNKAVTDGAGIKHDSGHECDRWQELQLMLKAGAIRDLRRQVAYVLAPAVDLGEARKKPALRYVADFVYVDVAAGMLVVEDAKSKVTRKHPLYRVKKHLMATVHGIIVKEV